MHFIKLFLSSIYQIIALQISKEKTTSPDVTKSITRYYNNRTVDEPYITAEFPAEEFKENFVVGDGTLFPTGNKRRKRAGEISI